MIPVHIAETLSDLRARRDFLNTAIDVLAQIWEEPSPASTVIADAVTGKVRKKYTRKKGPKNVKSAKVKAPRTPKAAPVETATEAAARREVILAAIVKSEVGLTGAEIKTATPKMESGDRQNALQALKAKGLIERQGNTWARA